MIKEGLGFFNTSWLKNEFKVRSGRRGLVKFENDIRRAKTLPSHFYFDQSIFEQEKEKVFRSTWQYVGLAEKLVKEGDYFVAEVAGESILILKNKNGIQAFSNVCRHRGSLLAEGSGHKKTLVCPYHAWSYDLEGKLRGCPEFEDISTLQSQFKLPLFPIEKWGPFLFVNISSSAPPLSKVLGKIPQEVAAQSLPLENYQFVYRKDYVVNCNWKVYIDNYLEGYHIPVVHPALYRELDYANYLIETFEFYSSQKSPLRSQEGSSNRKYTNENSNSGPLYYWIFPNFMLNFYPDNLSSNLIVPLSTDKTLTIFEWFVPRENKTLSEKQILEIAAFSDQVQAEDIRICEKVQKGLGSQFYDQGIYHPKRENGVHHFHGLIHSHLQDRHCEAKPKQTSI